VEAQKSSTILLVEDEGVIALAEARAISRFGYETMCAATGEEAIDLALENRVISLVLMDIDLGGGIDGTEAARRILARRSIPIVFLTSHAERDMVEKVRGLTRYGYVIKNSGDFVLQSSIEMAFDLFDAHEKTRAKEAELEAIYENAPILLLLLDGERRVHKANSRAVEFSDTPLERMIGLRNGDAMRCLNALEARDGCGTGPQCGSCVLRKTIVDSLESGISRNDAEVSLPLLSEGGAADSHFLVSTKLLRIFGKPMVLVSLMDISARRKAEDSLRRLNRELKAISSCNQVLMRASEERKLLDDICRIICDEAGYRMAWVGYAENDAAKNIRPVAWAGTEEGYLQRVRLTWADEDGGQGPAGVAIRTGRNSCIQDFATHQGRLPWRNEALERGYRSLIALPLNDEADRSFGVLCIYCIDPGAFVEGEARLLGELAGDLAFGIAALRARSERNRMERELGAREREYRSLVENLPDLIVRYDSDLRRTYVNPTWQEASGLEASMAVSKSATELLPERNREANRAYAEVLRETMASGTRRATEFNWVNARGETLYLSYTLVPEYDEQGRACGVLAVGHDLTERKKAEDEITRLNRELELRVVERTAQLESANKELEAFAYSVSHDLRAPLRHISGYAGLLVSAGRDNLSEKSAHYLDAIDASARQMSDLIDDLLRFSRIGRTGLRREHIDMNQNLGEVLKPLKESTAGRHVEWVIGDLPAIDGDYALMRQVWANLLGNSAKYTSRRPNARIEVGARVEGAEIVFFVADNGVGFDMKYVAKLFGVFQRLHSPEEFEGTGIGLAIVHRVISRHGGRVWAAGEPDNGATFFFSIPVNWVNHENQNTRNP